VLNPRQALSLTLAVNELATNATKYGALCAPGGKVDVEWSKTDNNRPQFLFTWRKHSGELISAPARQGFGSRVIKDFMAADFGGDVQLAFEPTGVVCRLTAPLENLPL
jgi:two-component sensor histidine kinase